MKKKTFNTFIFTLMCANLFMFDVGVASKSNGYVYNASDNTLGTSGNNLSATKEKFYSDYVLKNAKANLVHNQFGDQFVIPRGNGKMVSVRGMNPYPVATTPLQEGIPPAGNKMDLREVNCPVAQYGGYTPHTDMLSLINCNPLALMDSEELGSQAGRTVDILTREVLNAGTMVLYSPNVIDGVENKVTSRGSLTTSAKFTLKDIFRAARFLKRNNAPTFEGGYYVAIVHPDVEMDVLTSKGFKETTVYTEHVKRLFTGEIGAVGSVRFVRSSEAKVFKGEGADGIDVYSTLVLGKHAYATAKIDGGNLKHIIKPLGSAGSADPLDQIASRGWKLTHGACRTCEAFMIRVESAASYAEDFAE